MAFCAKCGSAVDGQFCPACGAAANPPGGAAAPMTGISAAGLTENMASALCYLAGFITGIIFLVLAPYNQNPRVRFHAFQSIFLNLAWIAVYIVLGMLMVTPGLIVMSAMLHGLVSLAGFVLWLFLMWKAYEGQTIVLPVIGPLAQKQAGR